MSGIVGYLGNGDAVSVLLQGLRKLEFYGYDSVGVAFLNDGSLKVHKKAEKMDLLEKELNSSNICSKIGIGHTRWATHGAPLDSNAHPHCDCTGKFAVVHNGIIENFHELRKQLEKKGHRFASDTDSEVIAHLVEEAYDGDLCSALRLALRQVRGSFAVALLSEHQPDRMIAARKNNSLVVGLGEGEQFLASEIPAILPFTRDVYLIDDDEFVELTPGNVRVLDFEGNQVNKEITHIDWDEAAAERGGFPHFMMKEIYEQPKALRETMRSSLDSLLLTPDQIRGFSKVIITACGTSYHAGLIGKYVLEKLARLPVEVEIASEFRYSDPLIDEKTLVIALSQSGETADTLAAVKEARKKGCYTLSVANVVDSTITRETDDVIYTRAGTEISIAATKAYTTQVMVMYLLGILFARARGECSTDQLQEIENALSQTPDLIEGILEQKGDFEGLASIYCRCENIFYLGRGLDCAVAMEGALKLKETSYIHAEAYPAGELKHGPLALIADGLPVVALATQEELLEKLISNIRAVKARGGSAIGVCMGENNMVDETFDHVFRLPKTLSFISPLLSAIPMQLFAYYMSVARGCNVDKPRNLAKSVTVE